MVSTRLQGALQVWITLLTLPPTILHELVHAAAAVPVADEVAIVIRPRDGQFEAAWWYPDEAGVSAAAERAIYLAPHLGGIVLSAIVAALALTRGWSLPDGFLAQLTWAVVGVWWVIFLAPSAADLSGGEAADA